MFDWLNEFILMATVQSEKMRGNTACTFWWNDDAFWPYLSMNIVGKRMEGNRHDGALRGNSEACYCSVIVSPRGPECVLVQQFPALRHRDTNHVRGTFMYPRVWLHITNRTFSRVSLPEGHKEWNIHHGLLWTRRKGPGTRALVRAGVRARNEEFVGIAAINH